MSWFHEPFVQWALWTNFLAMGQNFSLEISENLILNVVGAPFRASKKRKPNLKVDSVPLWSCGSSWVTLSALGRYVQLCFCGSGWHKMWKSQNTSRNQFAAIYFQAICSHRIFCISVTVYTLVPLTGCSDLKELILLLVAPNFFP